MNLFWLIVVFAYGTILGSFLNVCIYRLPRDKSIVIPSSRCPSCEVPLKFWHNIPLVSFIILRGKCKFCGAKISFQYFLVELITGVFLTFIFFIYGFSILFWHAMILFSLLMLVFYIDLEHQLILDVVTYPGILFGLIISFFMPKFFYGFKELFWEVSPCWLGNFLNALASGIFSLIIFILIREIATFLAKEEAMGLGDVKLAILIGVYLGLSKAIAAFILSFFLGALVSLPLLIFKIKNKKDPVPFGTFMSIGAIISLFYGNFLVSWYISFPDIFFKL